ncbi:cbb3-type cytochrome c oxidase subunit III [Fluviicoccus keumensis]|uniref:Cbb3-type cytochrome c oxidase subunit III n=1 Tax=Fluviicoccus keumensis TaxID=1435465 RepID=A0A4Q7ZCE8_9GAMM|nr:c-type cytochrome [Fluviicoccus keumensis]RZU47854.1 cbb3-type cytochrome c oxidase subunit III [Fluviicoccus keumensis]
MEAFITAVGRLAVLAGLVFPIMLLAPAARAESGKQFYQHICATCHADGGQLGAPVIGDRQAWAPRIARGKSALYATALKGGHAAAKSAAMPGKDDLEGRYSDRQIKAAVDYMIRRSQ